MPVDPNEELARFAVEKSYYRADNTIRPNAYMPDQEKAVSVFRQVGLSEGEIWELGATHVARPRNKQLLGRAVIIVREVLSQELNVESVEPPPRHANILGWPDEHEKQKEKALELAARATFVRR